MTLQTTIYYVYSYQSAKIMSNQTRDIVIDKLVLTCICVLRTSMLCILVLKMIEKMLLYQINK